MCGKTIIMSDADEVREFEDGSAEADGLDWKAIWPVTHEREAPRGRGTLELTPYSDNRPGPC